ncbi:MAG: hypothetical protein WC663_05665 [Patescibacteria group bacterium]|jgi:hypothetical protein
MIGEHPALDVEGPKNFENLDLQELNFEQFERAFQEIQELASKTFHQNENGFRNVKGEGIYIEKVGNIFKLSEVTPSLKEVHTFLATNANSVLTKGSSDKEEMIQAMKKMIEGLGNRII